MIPKTILITGASGLIGKSLTLMLQQNGFIVKHLGRTKQNGPVPSFVWDVEKQYMDKDALESVDAIIHLAGAGIADKRWSVKRKREILESRTRSTELLVQKLRECQHTVKVFISASAIGYYGFGSEKIFVEDDKPGNDFLANVVQQWESEVDRVASLGIRTVKIRTGIVLSDKGGALKEMARPVRFGVGSPLGDGKQHMSWIHIHDLCRMFMFALMNDHVSGAYNAVTPDWTTNAELTNEIASVLRRPLWLPSIPAFVLKIVLGEMADLVLKGSKVSCERIQQAGFEFEYLNLTDALQNLLVSSKH